MNQMLIKDHQKTVQDLLAEGQSLLREMGLGELSQEVEAQAQRSRTREAPQIMFYGLYNAGKSTLINALCQKEIAQVGDVPTTASIQSIPWEGYTLVDTPGINARDEHTQIATEEIDKSDLVLFIVDNGDGFEREIVAQAITSILKRGKAVAVVINQKNVDDSEDANLPVPQRSSMTRVSEKVLENLRRQSLAEGFDILDEGKNFLGAFQVNAQTAWLSSQFSDPADHDLLYRQSGIDSLVNAMDRSIRASSRVRMLLTPVTFLKEKLKEALAVYGNTSLFGDQAEYAKQRKILTESRQRTNDRLIAEGMRKIEACFEQIRAAAANGQPFDDAVAKLQEDLNKLVKDVAAQESEIVHVEISGLSLPEAGSVGSTEGPAEADGESALSSSLVDGLGIIELEEKTKNVPSDPRIIIVVEIIRGIVGLISDWIKSNAKEERIAREQARQSAEQLAAYYKFLNELRDQEAKVKADYSAAVQDLLKRQFDIQLEQLDKALSQVSDACAEHTAYIGKVEKLIVRTSDEVSELSLAI